MDIKKINKLMSVGLTEEQFEIINNYINELLVNKDKIVKNTKSFVDDESRYMLFCDSRYGSGKSFIANEIIKKYEFVNKFINENNLEGRNYQIVLLKFIQFMEAEKNE